MNRFVQSLKVVTYMLAVTDLFLHGLSLNQRSLLSKGLFKIVNSLVLSTCILSRYKALYFKDIEIKH